MKKRDVDVAIIGAGTAGMVAYQRVRQVTDKVVLIEADQYGTTCARVGCMPSKLLIAAADNAHQMGLGELFGVSAGDMRVDGKRVMERVRAERDRFVGSVIRSVEKFPQEHRLMGPARFTGPNDLVVGDNLEVDARRIIIATGSRPSVPAFLEEARDRLVVNDDIFEWQTLPQSVVVFGPGVIGLELGQALSRLGVRVRMFGVGGAVGPIRDDSIRAYALETFKDEFPLDPDADVKNVERVDGGVAVTFMDGEAGERTEVFDYLLAATGRRPNVDGLDIQNAGIELDEKGMPLFDPHTLRCGQSHIFIAGDANNSLPLLHEAADEGRIAGDNAAAYPDVRVGLRRTPLAVVFTDPQIATVGLTIQQVDERCGGCFAVGEVSFEDQGRSRVIGKNRGLLRVYGEHGSGLFMGAEMFGPAAEHIAHLLAWSAQRRLTVSEMLEMPFYHPVIEEGLRTALKDLNRNLSIGPAPVDDCTDCGPGG
ncbi:dihydrolipoyl dehydrogenase [Marinobacter subterrani]|uniref:Pyruvate/2-oxoglutarate dehydrogenase complex, dihydrolipoamide dehydrogenase (E3) component n=1 Tax=Marinobacter subterrani TaxID=1658765 RepID=A0A0J7M6H8_9GAMM|nr:dihydrolipoyl dehydrogenase [Marinobacter subterrani]KMQ76535.1 Pyruvate/2-oxoglutarate dehydrogenase complex, dihydrolipoamide dehydrogenase (E3) component [Marinobacter subterrani]